MNDLDKALRVLTATQNALQTEAQKKKAVLEKTTSYVATLQQDNDRLQEVLMLSVFLSARQCVSVYCHDYLFANICDIGCHSFPAVSSI